jgi:uncharacterized protein
VSEIEARIAAELARIEASESVTILYACESGSRAWGFESTDSDYDVRFIYLRRTPWYLSIQDRRDVIELPIDDVLDISGWDLPKALGLYRKSNPPLLEWLRSPIVYRRRSTLVDRLRSLENDFYSPKSCMYHYLNMARGNFREYLRGDEVRVKKYFYVLRPTLACLWIERGLGVVPMEFADLVSGVVTDETMRSEIDSLLERKRAGMESDRGPKMPAISAFLERELERLEASTQPPSRASGPEALDRLFHEILVEVNGPDIHTDITGPPRQGRRP